MLNKGKILSLAKGFRGRAKNCYRIAKMRVEKALQYQFRDRRTKKRDMRALWITRVNAGARQYGVRGLRGVAEPSMSALRRALAPRAPRGASSAIIALAVERGGRGEKGQGAEGVGGARGCAMADATERDGCVLRSGLGRNGFAFANDMRGLAVADGIANPVMQSAG